MNQMQTDYIDDEIDIMPYVSHLLSYWRLFLVGIVIAPFIAFFIFKNQPKQYRSTMTFFMPNASVSTGSKPSLLNSFGISGSTQNGAYTGYLMPIFESRRIKEYVAHKLLMIPYFSDMIHNAKVDEAQKIDFLFNEIKINNDNVLLTSKKGVYSLTYISTNPDYVLPVLDTYLEALIELNDELNIDSSLIQIIPLDKARYPTSHFAPTFMPYLLYSMIGVLGAIAFVLILIMIIDKIKHLQSKQ